MIVDSKTIDNSLKTRVRSAFLLGMLVLFALLYGGIAFALLMGVAAGISVYEWGKMVLSGKEYRILLMIFGLFYIGLSTGAMIWLRMSPEGFYNTLTLLLIVWASDISAYFSGKAIGGPKLAPAISPKKTWAGFIGSSVGAGIVAGGLACPALLAKFGLTTIGHMSPPMYGAMGFMLAMFGQVGDLFISIFKRRYGVKDTGTIIPGHGGVLDRIDALLLVSIVFGLIKLHFT
jgi:phosphatidate cytidylyltransferase